MSSSSSRFSLRCAFLTLFFFAAACAAVFVGVGYGAAADTYGAFSGDQCSGGDLCDAYRDQASALYAVTSVAVVGTIVDTALVTVFVLLMMVSDSYNAGRGFGIATGATVFTGLVLLNASFAFLGSLRLFQLAHGDAGASGWNESLYKAAIAFGVLSGAQFSVLGALMACCTRRITSKAREPALERLP